jgi:aminoglycoside 6'-N-acetyltransferase
MEGTLRGSRVFLRAATPDDVDALAKIRSTPEVYARWRGGDDLRVAVVGDLAEADVTTYVIEFDGRPAGAVQYSSEEDPDYRHANIDLYLDPAVHGQGLGADAVRTLARHLFDDVGHHRIEIDPAADNAAAIRCYEKVGFRPVGIMRGYERGPEGKWHDSLLMDLLAGEITE